MYYTTAKTSSIMSHTSAHTRPHKSEHQHIPVHCRCAHQPLPAHLPVHCTVNDSYQCTCEEDMQLHSGDCECCAASPHLLADVNFSSYERYMTAADRHEQKFDYDNRLSWQAHSDNSDILSLFLHNDENGCSYLPYAFIQWRAPQMPLSCFQVPHSSERKEAEHT